MFDFVAGISLHSARKSPNTNSLPQSRWFRLHCLVVDLDGRLFGSPTETSVADRYSLVLVSSVFFTVRQTVVPRHEILSIIRLILNTLTVAMRFEPGNARLFENEVGRFTPLHRRFKAFRSARSDGKVFVMRSDCSVVSTAKRA